MSTLYKCLSYIFINLCVLSGFDFCGVFFFVHSQVLISNGKAVGVEYLQNGRREVVGANKEVILAAGPINSPHLLILSGVGPKDHLLDHKVHVACIL